MRIISVFATAYHYRLRDERLWGYRHRRPADLTQQIDLGQWADFYRLTQQQLVEVLSVTRVTAGSLGLPPRSDGDVEPDPQITDAVLWLFLLPSDEIVAALGVTLDVPADGAHARPVIRVLAACSAASVTIDGAPLGDRVAAAVKAATDDQADQDEASVLTIERHQLVLLPQTGRSLSHLLVPAVLGVHHPETAPQPDRPDDLNQGGQAAALTARVTILHGYPGPAENVLLLAAVQSVATAARLRRLWFRLGEVIREFRDNRQTVIVGIQQRSDFEVLMDKVGYLELDFGYSVEYQSQISRLAPSEFMRSYHTALVDQLELVEQAATISRLFDRVSRSVSAEMTAIEIRERRARDAAEVRGNLPRLVLTSIGLPLGFLFLFFGINGTQVDPARSILDVHYYAWAYGVAAVLAAAPTLLAAVLSALRRRFVSGDRP